MDGQHLFFGRGLMPTSWQESIGSSGACRKESTIAMRASACQLHHVTTSSWFIERANVNCTVPAQAECFDLVSTNSGVAPPANLTHALHCATTPGFGRRPWHRLDGYSVDMLPRAPAECAAYRLSAMVHASCLHMHARGIRSTVNMRATCEQHLDHH